MKSVKSYAFLKCTIMAPFFFERKTKLNTSPGNTAASHAGVFLWESSYFVRLPDQIRAALKTPARAWDGYLASNKAKD